MKHKSARVVTCLPQPLPCLQPVRIAEVQHGGPESGRNPCLAHAAAARRASTSALMSETNRSTSHASSSSASSSDVNAPSWLRRRSSCAHAEARSDGRNSMISFSAGRRARKEMTSCRKAELPDQVRRRPRAIISATRSRSGSNCLASLSGISMVICISQTLTDLVSGVKSPAVLATVTSVQHSVTLFRPSCSSAS